MIRAALGYLRSHFCADDDRLYLTLNGSVRVSAILEAFKPLHGGDDFTLRLTIHDKTALTAFINDPNGSIELEGSTAVVRGLAQFLLRRLREEANPPAEFSIRQFHEANYGQDENRDWRKNIYVENESGRASGH